ncbi:hypothetical protein [Flavobacterium algicola]|uniref:hypothetical protein n=1 Tax=Flavobacterium algicola TaxID=556529 RepID=UPI001EFE08DA|nr:hypothetical protein [Flavobacterium algicola]MCG9791471.1 hypothetical protein [Flavobacterium algicola]
MKKIHFILILLIGAFMMPTSVFACGNNSKQKSCTKEMSSHKGMKNCCKKKTGSNDKEHSGCSGKCGNALCSVSTLNLGIVSAFTIETNSDVFNFSTKRQKFYHSVSFTSEGYSSIWLIPKIS